MPTLPSADEPTTPSPTRINYPKVPPTAIAALQAALVPSTWLGASGGAGAVADGLAGRLAEGLSPQTQVLATGLQPRSRGFAPAAAGV